MSLFTRLSVAALLSGCFLFGGVPASAEEPAGDTTFQVAKGDAKGKGAKKKGKKGKKKGGKKKGGKKGKKPSKAASA